MKHKFKVNGTYLFMNYHCKKIFFLTLVFLLSFGSVYSSHKALVPVFAKADKQKTIVGTVKDTNSKPIPGVAIFVKGTSTSTISDIDGKFSIVASGDDTLMFHYLGLKTEEVLIQNQTLINVTMVEDVQGLDEIVVVGYGQRKKATLTGSISTIDGDDISEAPVGNVTSALAGQVAGLKVVNRSGQPGSDGSLLNIRGFGAPLILVDGLPQDFGYLDPNEIESISVLKDASSSIYGARAGNGVILVTTKRGKEGKPIFNFNYATSISAPTKIVDLANATLYAQLVNEADIADGNTPTFSDEEVAKFKTGTDPRYPNTNWWDETFSDWAPMTDYNLNVRGGAKSVNYFLSLGYLNQESMLRSNDIKFERFSFRSNIDVDVSENFKIGLDISGRKEYRNEPGRGIGVIMTAVQAAKPTKPAYYPDLTKPTYPGFDADWANPLPISDKDFSGYVDNQFQSIRGTLDLTYDFKDFVEGLTAEVKVDYRMNDAFIKNWRTPFDYNEYDYDNDTYTVATIFNGGRTSLNQTYNKDWLAYGYFKLAYNKSYKEHSFSGKYLTEAQASRGDDFNAYREGFITQEIDQLFAGSDENKDNNGSASEDGRMSHLATLGYNYKEKYFADLIFRYDGSVRFKEGYRWGFFPGVTVGWRLSEESFIKNNFKNIDNLKLRMSYGQAGDEGSVQFNYLTGYNFGRSYIFDSSEEIARGLASRGLANPFASWAETETYNIGLDGSLYNRLLFFETNVFYRKKSGILATRVFATPSTFGGDLPQENLNSQDNRGFEVELGHTNRVTDDFKYSVKGNFSWSRAKWIHFEEAEFTTEAERARRQLSGQWTNIAWGFESDGLFSSQEEIDNWADITNGGNNNVIKPGDIKYIDQNDDGVINWEDEVEIGKSTLPEIFYGLNLDFTYKDFSLNVLFQGATNYSVFYSNQFTAPFGVNFVPFAFWEDRWTEENPDPNNSLPRVRYGASGTHPNGNSSTFWTIKNAYYVRLRNLQLNYNIPNNVTEKLGLKDLRIYLQGFNLATFTNVRHRDPESDNTAGRNYPQQTSLSLGLNLKF
ncbi:TonB-dependent receptor [uncultured Polaribacter sp.]|uniref:SusC/RagA family TonB-linked outer membrane protein n=1 Tax=uncultured Polaribacter sp. TaxID=174711 RepID=UPI0026064FC9|nr:TonB-dependent receptor [uncultured Polaribacter sp.]